MKDYYVCDNCKKVIKPKKTICLIGSAKTLYFCKTCGKVVINDGKPKDKDSRK